MRKGRPKPARITQLVYTALTVGLLLTMGAAFYVLSELDGKGPKPVVSSAQLRLRIHSGSRRRGFKASKDDDYCDYLRAAGAGEAEEALTSACSFSTVGRRLFHCKRNMEGQDLIFSSRVDDGVCDCCDGSDEHIGLAVCTDACAVSFSPPKRLREKRAWPERDGGETRI